VLYYGSAMPVSAVTVQMQGGTPLAVDTDGSGQFAFSGVAAGAWQVQPQKSGGGAGAVSALDAVYVLQAAVGQRTLTPEQQMACDVSGNALVSALDAVYILQYQVGLITQFPVAQTCGSDWVFMPSASTASNQVVMQPQMSAGTCRAGAIAFDPLVGQATGQNFEALLFGDCTGNWQPSGGAAAERVGRPSRVRLGRGGRHAQHVRVPVYVDSPATFRALDLRVRYDPSRFMISKVAALPASAPFLLEANERSRGVVDVALASASPLRRGPLLVLDLIAKGRDRRGSGVSIESAAVDGN